MLKKNKILIFLKINYLEKSEDNSIKIKNLIGEIQSLDEEIFQKNSQIKIEELKAKTCSDETIKSFETLLDSNLFYYIVIKLYIKFFRIKSRN